MKTYLVPVDFSAAAENAAFLAAHLTHQSGAQRIVLMNAYYITPYEELLPNPDMLMLREQEVEESAAERIENLSALRDKLRAEVRAGVEISIRLNRSHLVRAVVDAVEEDKVDMVILGSIGNSTIRENGVGIGSHVTNVSKASPAPVLVVPPAYTYQTIKRIAIACDLKKVKESIPVEALHKLLGTQPIELLVVNIDAAEKQASADPQILAEQTSLYEMLEKYSPTYHYINTPNVIAGVLNFANEQDTQLIIALPHKYSFLRSLLHSSVSRQLASCATVPVLLLK
ncbi:universal stress protein [Mucilaginibacter terrenus]|uniref:Universal stress protein n=1 Tax=Mucilaginibacter terrenus TaxID=2482727 RepID=A0A3E2NTL3_9SPHI|nr:universal stress protein [Mucilaginibacter terrenus]RFZ84346.1 universal stress protein [Mucilaginibacter terrenus]